MDARHLVGQNGLAGYGCASAPLMGHAGPCPGSLAHANRAPPVATTPNFQMVVGGGTVVAPTQTQPTQAADLRDAEVSILRSRLQQIERDNVRLRNELTASKDTGNQSEKVRQCKQENEKLNGELRYAQQDIKTADEERRRLCSSLQAAQSEVSSLKDNLQQQQMQSQKQLQQPVVAAPQTASPPAPVPVVVPVAAIAMPAVTFTGAPLQKPAAREREVLLRELACWEASASTTSPAPDGAHDRAWFALRGAVEQLGGGSQSAAGDVAAAASARFSEATNVRRWVAVRGGARFVRVWLGLFPKSATDLVAAQDVAIFDAVANALHRATLKQDDESSPLGAREPLEESLRAGCVVALLEALLEVAGTLRRDDLRALGAVMRRPSLCALVGRPQVGQLHLLSLRLMKVLLASPELFTAAHQADSDVNPLLAAANLLIVPWVRFTEGKRKTPAADDDEAEPNEDSPERQECRIATLELFCRCVATARLEKVMGKDGPDTVLQLRAVGHSSDEDAVDTVLQRTALLCHHELLCLGLHGTGRSSQGSGPWVYDVGFRACATRRLRAVELSLLLLSSAAPGPPADFAWAAPGQKIPAAATTQGLDSMVHREACSKACEAFGRTRPLLSSIVEMVASRAVADSTSPYGRLCGAASTLRVLLPHADGECLRDEDEVDSSDVVMAAASAPTRGAAVASHHPNAALSAGSVGVATSSNIAPAGAAKPPPRGRIAQAGATMGRTATGPVVVMEVDG